MCTGSDEKNLPSLKMVLRKKFICTLPEPVFRNGCYGIGHCPSLSGGRGISRFKECCCEVQKLVDPAIFWNACTCSVHSCTSRSRTVAVSSILTLLSIISGKCKHFIFKHHPKYSNLIFKVVSQGDVECDVCVECVGTVFQSTGSDENNLPSLKALLRKQFMCTLT